MKCSLGTALILTCAALPAGLRAGTMYMYIYTGYSLVGGTTCPIQAGCSIDGSFLVSAPLAPGLTAAELTPTAFAFYIAGAATPTQWTDSSGAIVQDFQISTDAMGNLIDWDIWMSSPTATGAPGFDACDNVDALNVAPYGCDPGLSVSSWNTIEGEPSTLFPGAWSPAITVDTLADLSGGSVFAPVPIVEKAAPVSKITGLIDGYGSEDYYSFSWSGGPFSASATVSGAPDSGASYVFSEGLVGSCASTAVDLDSTDYFSGNISLANLPAGEYCIGIYSDSPDDPAFSLIFNTPVSGSTPEPSVFILLSIGLGMIGFSGLSRRRSLCSHR